MFESAETGIEANRGRMRPIGEMLRLALANKCRAEAIQQETGNLRAHFEGEIKNTHLVVAGANEFTNIDARAALDDHAE